LPSPLRCVLLCLGSPVYSHATAGLQMTEREALRPGDRVLHIGGGGVPVSLRRTVLSRQNAMAPGDVPLLVTGPQGVTVCLSLCEVGVTFLTRILRRLLFLRGNVRTKRTMRTKSPGRGGVSVRKEQ
jgi:hypothetical protein